VEFGHDAFMDLVQEANKLVDYLLENYGHGFTESDRANTELAGGESAGGESATMGLVSSIAERDCGLVTSLAFVRLNSLAFARSTSLAFARLFG
jgi:hypothetical protein